MQRSLTLLFCLMLWGCQTVQKKPEDLPFHLLYQPIEDAEARGFLRAGIDYLIHNYGSTRFPVNEVLLRYSGKNELGREYRIAEHFSRTEVVDAEAGIFTIYIAVPPDDPEFYPLLAHEIGHLKYPLRVDDWEMEGFCMVFSEELCAAQGKDWSIWKKRFDKDSDDPYAQAYWRAKRK